MSAPARLWWHEAARCSWAALGLVVAVGVLSGVLSQLVAGSTAGLLAAAGAHSAVVGAGLCAASAVCRTRPVDLHLSTPRTWADAVARRLVVTAAAGAVAVLANTVLGPTGRSPLTSLVPLVVAVAAGGWVGVRSGSASAASVAVLSAWLVSALLLDRFAVVGLVLVTAAVGAVIVALNRALADTERLCEVGAR